MQMEEGVKRVRAIHGAWRTAARRRFGNEAGGSLALNGIGADSECESENSC
jgi:hypothetical protein